MERRRAPRFSIDQIIEISYKRENYMYAHGLNISELGLLLELDDVPDTSATVNLLLTIPTAEGEAHIECQGLFVRWTNKGDKVEAGLQFTELSAKDREIIREYTKNLPPLP